MNNLILILTILLMSCGAVVDSPFNNTEIVAVNYLHAMDARAAESVHADTIDILAFDTVRKVICDLSSIDHLFGLLTSEFNEDSMRYKGTSLLEFELVDGSNRYAAYYPNVGIFRFFDNNSFGVRYSVSMAYRKELIENMNRCGSYLLRWNQKEKIKKQPTTKKRANAHDVGF